MTTIDSDSESQDSDDGRRFRFEATRKDDALRLQGQNKRRSSPSKSSNYRSRSGDRGSHNRRDHDKGKQDRDRKEDKRRSSRDRESRDNKYDNKNNSKESRHGNNKEIQESKSSLNGSRSSNYRDNSKDYKNSKELSRSREPKNSNARDSKETKLREAKDVRDRETKDSRDRERGPKRSRDVSHDRLSNTKHGHRSAREKYNKGRERSDNRDKARQLETEKQKSEESKSKDDPPHEKRSSRKGSERKNLKRDAHSPSKILEQIGSDCESDLGALDPDVGPVMALDTFEDCREMNLSDFDIISDTEGSSSSDTTDPKIPKSRGGPIIKGEILPPHYYGPKITKRVSRRQYERLVRRQAAINTRRLEELYKVNPRNNEKSSTPPLDPSCNNASAVSDFLLGPEAAGEHRRSQNMGKDHSEDSDEDRESTDNKKKKKNKQDQESFNKIQYLQKIDTLSSDYSHSSQDHHREQKSQDNVVFDSQIYGPTLPPKYQNSINKKEPGEKTFVQNLQLASPHPKVSPISTEKNDSGEKKSLKSIPSDSRLPLVNNDSKNTVIGPTLPPEFATDTESRKSESEECGSGAESEDKPVQIIGPTLPPHLKREISHSATSESQDSTDVNSASNSVFGPTLPPHLVSKVFSDNVEQKLDSDSDSDQEFLGPMPPDHPAALNNYIQLQLEERANRMRNKLDSKNLVVEKREEWMIELPSAQATNLGLGNKRQFRNRAGPDMSDRSSWTDTPADKARKKEDRLIGKLKAADPAKESERLAIQERDKAMEKMAEKQASKKRKESLLEIHKKKLNKKKKKEEKEAKEAGKQTRRPFDRDIDLQANRFDEAQKKSILNKAQLLNDRFSRGESKYL